VLAVLPPPPSFNVAQLIGVLFAVVVFVVLAVVIIWVCRRRHLKQQRSMQARSPPLPSRSVAC
jgi:hypothetical protein